MNQRIILTIDTHAHLLSYFGGFRICGVSDMSWFSGLNRPRSYWVGCRIAGPLTDKGYWRIQCRRGSIMVLLWQAACRPNSRNSPGIVGTMEGTRKIVYRSSRAALRAYMALQWKRWRNTSGSNRRRPAGIWMAWPWSTGCASTLKPLPNTGGGHTHSCPARQRTRA